MSLTKRVLLLGPASPIEQVILSLGDELDRTEAPLTLERASGADFLVSWRYRHIIGGEILARFPKRAINLHPSILPWNRGTHVNLWNILDGTPRGVTIHHMDEGLDTGALIAQRPVGLDVQRDTLATSYDALVAAMEALFAEWWPAIRSERVPAIAQPPGGSYHRTSDIHEVEHLLTKGWDTPVADLLPAKTGRRALTGAAYS